MNLYKLDRIQYSKTEDEYYFFEFFKVNEGEIRKNSEAQLEVFLNYFKEKHLIGKAKEKHEILRQIIKDYDKTKYYFIIYSDDKDESKILITYESDCNGVSKKFTDFNELRDWFIKINGVDNDINNYSKTLGDIGHNRFVHKILEEINDKDDELPFDDQGLEITKNLLIRKDKYGEEIKETTKGFDLDLFQYVNKKLIVYEFLTNEKEYLSNNKCHPMRYCWTGEKKDNKEKFISLWKTKEFFNGELFLINHSKVEEDVSVLKIIDLEVDEGIKSEIKLNMSYEPFKSWLKFKGNNRYLYETNYYGIDFFNNFDEKKNEYN